MTCSQDRLSRSPGHLLKLMESSRCKVYVAFVEARVAAALVGWDPKHPPTTLDTVPPFFQRALGIDVPADAPEVAKFNLRIAATVLTALRQRSLSKPMLLPLDMREHLKRGKRVAEELSTIEQQDAAFGRTFQTTFGARRTPGTEHWAAAMLRAMGECDPQHRDLLHREELTAVRAGLFVMNIYTRHHSIRASTSCGSTYPGLGLCICRPWPSPHGGATTRAVTMASRSKTAAAPAASATRGAIASALARRWAPAPPHFASATVHCARRCVKSPGPHGPRPPSRRAYVHAARRCGRQASAERAIYSIIEEDLWTNAACAASAARCLRTRTKLSGQDTPASPAWTGATTQ